jgi:hypothetical protein
MTKIGDRVVAVFESADNIVKIFGEGIYDGDFVPYEAAGNMAKMLSELDMKNPRIRLDNGKIVYGCECWWSSVDKFKEQTKNMTIVQVDIDEMRGKYET